MFLIWVRKTFNIAMLQVSVYTSAHAAVQYIVHNYEVVYPLPVLSHWDGRSKVMIWHGDPLPYI